MDALISVGLPVALAIIMLSLGLGLTGQDFLNVVREPKAFLIGFTAQVVLIPVIAFGLLQIIELEDALAFGVMILAFCPGGATTNLLARFARGDVALSVSLTAVVSVLSVITIPLLVGLSADYFLDESAIDVDITRVALSLFAISTVPVLIGMAIRKFAPDFTSKAEPRFIKAAGVLFVIIVAGALAANIDVFFDNLGTLAPILVSLNVLLLAVGYGLAKFGGLSARRRATVSIEAGVQNSTLGIAVAAILDDSSALPDFALPAAAYGILMYAITIPTIYFLLRQPAEESDPSESIPAG